jgi:hypothetical protein
MDPRWVVLVAANLLLIFLGGQCNHYLAHLPVSVFLGGLFLPVAGLRLRMKPGFIALFLTGLFFDAARPVPFGSSALLLGALFATWYTFRPRLPREGMGAAVTGALLANAALFFAQPLLLGPGLASAAATGSRVFWDFVFSEIAVALLGPWFFALQEKALFLWGVNLAEEAREPGGAL